MNLREEIINLENCNDCKENIKLKMLEFEKELIMDYIPNKEDAFEYRLKRRLLKKHKEIMGDWEK